MTTNGNGHLPMHELATLFPPMSAEEFTALKDDIAEYGIHQPVAVWRGSVIDGRNRYLAAQELGVEAPRRYLDDDVDPVGFVLSANMNRRNLSASQRAIVMAALPKLSWGRTKSESKPAKAGLLSTAATRAEKAAISESLQGKADVIHNYGDENLIAQIRQGTLMVDDAYKGIRESVKAKRAAEKAKQDRIATEKALALAEANRLAAEQAEREAIEKARANRLAAEQAEREAIEKARAEREAAEQAEREAIEKARAEREVAEREAAAQRAAAEAAEREAAEKASAEREATEREAAAQRAAAEAAQREAIEKARAEREADLLVAAQQQMVEDPTVSKLSTALKEQHRKNALATAEEAERQAREHLENLGVDAEAHIVPVGYRSRVIFADSLHEDKGLDSLANGSVALTFTSPPYWTFAEYGGTGVGYEDSYVKYLESLEDVFGSVWGKTMPGGRVIINISNMKSKRSIDGESFVYPIVPDLIQMMGGKGFRFFDEIIWHKRDTTTGPMDGSPLWGSYPYPPTPKMLDSTFENILVFTKPGQREVDLGVKEQSRLTVDEWREFTKGVWRIESGSTPGHPATFPMEIADRVVRLYSFFNDLVIDPFAGTGTTVIAAERNKRVGTGYEISPLYMADVRQKAAEWLNGEPNE